MVKMLLIGLLAALLISVMLLAGSVVRNSELEYAIQDLRKENARLTQELKAVRYSLGLDGAIDGIDANEWLRENGLLRTED